MLHPEMPLLTGQQECFYRIYIMGLLPPAFSLVKDFGVEVLGLVVNTEFSTSCLLVKLSNERSPLDLKCVSGVKQFYRCGVVYNTYSRTLVKFVSTRRKRCEESGQLHHHPAISSTSTTFQEGTFVLWQPRPLATPSRPRYLSCCTYRYSCGQVCLETGVPSIQVSEAFNKCSLAEGTFRHQRSGILSRTAFNSLFAFK